MQTPPRHIDGLEALAACVGQELGCSDWLRVAQSRIDAFADATDDRQWIHVDAERARRESPYGGPIAHGYLTLSMLPALIESCLRIDGIAMAVNYGLDRVRFPAPVPAGARVRVRVALAALEPVKGGVQAAWDATIEIEGDTRPACVARMLARYYPTNP